jgi:hypothetical protein
MVARRAIVMRLMHTTEVALECLEGHRKRKGNSIPFAFEYCETNFANPSVWTPQREMSRVLQMCEEGGSLEELATLGMKRTSG